MRCPNCDEPLDLSQGYSFCPVCFLVENYIPFDSEYHSGVIIPEGDDYRVEAVGPNDGAWLREG